MSNFCGGHKEEPPVAITLTSSTSKACTSRESQHGKSLLKSSKALTGRHLSASLAKTRANERAVSIPLPTLTPRSSKPQTSISREGQRGKAQPLKSSKPTTDFVGSMSLAEKGYGAAAQSFNSLSYRTKSTSHLPISQQESAQKTGAIKKNRDDQNRSTTGRASSTIGTTKSQYAECTSPVPNGSIRKLAAGNSKSLNRNGSVSGILSSKSSARKSSATGTNDLKNTVGSISARSARGYTRATSITCLATDNGDTNVTKCQSLNIGQDVDEGEKSENLLKKKIKSAIDDFLEPLQETLLEWQNSCEEDKLAFYTKKIKIQLQETFERNNLWSIEKELEDHPGKGSFEIAHRKLAKDDVAHGEELVRSKRERKNERKKTLTEQLLNKPALNEEIKVLKKTLHDTNSRLTSLEIEKQDLTLELQVANMKLNNLEDETEEKLLHMQQTHDEQVGQLRSSLDTLVREKQFLYGDLQDSKRENTDMAKQLQEKQQKISEFDNIIQTSLEDLQNEIDSLRESSEVKCQEMDSLNWQIYQDKLRIDELTKDGEVSKQQIDEQTLLIDTLKSSERTLHEKLDERMLQIKEKNIAINELRAMLHSRTERCKKLCEELSNGREQILINESSIYLLETRHNLSQELRERLEETIENLKAQKAALLEIIENYCKKLIDHFNVRPEVCTEVCTEVGTQTNEFTDGSEVSSQMGETGSAHAEADSELRAKNEEIKYLYIKLADQQMRLSEHDELIQTVQSQKYDIEQKDEEIAKLKQTIENREKNKSNTAEASTEDSDDAVADCSLLNREFYLERKREKRRKEVNSHT